MHPSIRHLFDRYVNEELTPAQKRKVDTWKKGDNSFSNHAFGEGEDRATHSLESPTAPQSEHLPKIEQHLSQHGFKVKDYTAGKATDKYGREVNIGKILNRTGATDELKKGFEADPARGQARTASSNLSMTVSRHPHDVAGMTSKGHSWQEESCMNFANGCNRNYLPADVRRGTHVAYLHHKDDTDMTRPLARIALKKYTNVDDPNDHILRPENRTYGSAPDAFSHTVNRWVNKHFPGKSNAIYQKNPEVYDDTGNTYAIGEHALDRAVVHPDYAVRKEVARNPRLTKKHLDTLMLDDKGQIVRAALKNPNIDSSHVETAHYRDINGALAHPKASKRILTDALTSKDENGEHTYNQWKRSDAASNPNATAAHLNAAVNDPSEMVRNYASRNSNLNSAHISKLLEDHNEAVRASVALHPNLTSRHINRALVAEMTPDGSHSVLANLTRHKNFNSTHIDRLLNHSDPIIRRYAIRSENASSANISRALKDENYTVRNDAIKNPNANSSHITKVLKDGLLFDRVAAVKHPNFGPEHVAQALHPSQELSVRTSAARHSAATPSQISAALRDRHVGVRMAAIENPNATSDHIHMAIKDGDDLVRQVALHNPNTTREHLEAAANGHPDMYSTEVAKSLLKSLNKKRK